WSVAKFPAEVAVAKIHIDVTGELGVLGANARRPGCKAYSGHLSQWDGAAVRQRNENLGCDRLRVAAVVARIAHAHGIALTSFDRRRHWLGAERHRDEILQITDHEAVARELRSIGIDVEVIAADHPLRIGAGRPRPGTAD